MPADATAPRLLRLVDEDGHELGLHRAVDLDEDEAGVRHGVDRGARLGLVGDQHLRRALERAGPVHDARSYTMRGPSVSLSQVFMRSRLAGSAAMSRTCRSRLRRGAGSPSAGSG